MGHHITLPRGVRLHTGTGAIVSCPNNGFFKPGNGGPPELKMLWAEATPAGRPAHSTQQSPPINTTGSCKMTKSFIKTAWDQQMSGIPKANLTQRSDFSACEVDRVHGTSSIWEESKGKNGGRTHRFAFFALVFEIPSHCARADKQNVRDNTQTKPIDTSCRKWRVCRVCNVRCLQAQDSSTPTKQTEKVKALCWFNDDLWCWCNRTATLYKPSRSIRLKRPQKSMSGCILVLDNQVPEQLRNRSNEAHARNIQ